MIFPFYHDDPELCTHHVACWAVMRLTVSPDWIQSKYLVAIQ